MGRINHRKWLLKLSSSDKFAATHIWASSLGIPLCAWPLTQTTYSMIMSELFKASFHICNFSYYLIIAGIKRNNTKRKKSCSFKKKNKEFKSLINMKISSISEKSKSSLISGLFSCIQDWCEKTETSRFFASFFLPFSLLAVLRNLQKSCYLYYFRAQDYCNCTLLPMHESRKKHLYILYTVQTPEIYHKYG